MFPIHQKLVLTVRLGSVVWMKEILLEPGDNVSRVAGGSFGGNFITFEPGNDGSMRLNTIPTILTKILDWTFR